MKQVEYIYQIRHKKTGSYFTGKRGQGFYTKPNYAVLSFNNIYGRDKFQNQVEWELVRFKLIEDKKWINE